MPGGDEVTDKQDPDKLQSWIRSGEPQRWVADHSGRWGNEEWHSLLELVRTGPFGPLEEHDVRLVIEVTAAEYQRSLITGAPIEQSIPAPSIRSYAVGLAVVGLASGFLAGASSTPIVATLLPLLFALVGGAGGLYLATADLTSPHIGWRVRALGLALAAFGAALLIGSSVGIGIRLHFAETVRNDELVKSWRGTTQDALQLAALRKKLEILGLGLEGQRQVLKVASAELEDATRPIAGARLQELLSLEHLLSDQLKEAIGKSSTLHLAVPEDVPGLQKELDSFSHHATPWLTSGMPRDLYAIGLDPMFYHLSRVALTNNLDMMAWLNSSGFNRDTLDRLFQNIHADVLLEDTLDWKLGRPVSDQLDRLLKLTLAPAKAAEKPEEVMPDIATSAGLREPEAPKADKKGESRP
jgi:hypothetical protein